jgi:hypothetical protein
MNFRLRMAGAHSGEHGRHDERIPDVFELDEQEPHLPSRSGFQQNAAEKPSFSRE